MAARASGLARTRIAGRRCPVSVIWPTPSTWLNWRASTVSVWSLSSVSDSVPEVTLRIRMGLSAGFTLRQVGRLGISAGKRPAAVLMAA
ncbi:hypothetical protein D3C72_2135200 [compost metagenome]